MEESNFPTHQPWSLERCPISFKIRGNYFFLIGLIYGIIFVYCLQGSWCASLISFFCCYFLLQSSICPPMTNSIDVSQVSGSYLCEVHLILSYCTLLTLFLCAAVSWYSLLVLQFCFWLLGSTDFHLGWGYFVLLSYSHFLKRTMNYSSIFSLNLRRRRD